MFKLFEWFRDNPSHELTQEDLHVASGKRELSTDQSARYFKNLSVNSGALESAFHKQAEAAAVRVITTLSYVHSHDPNRVHGIKIDLYNCWWNGLSHVTSPLKKLNALNYGAY